MSKMYHFQVDLDMVLEDTRNAMNRTCVQGAARSELDRRGLNSKILQESGPAGGNALVRLSGSKVALETYIDEVYCGGDAEDAALFKERIVPYEPVRRS
jgi:hypothetical protein